MTFSSNSPKKSRRAREGESSAVQNPKTIFVCKVEHINDDHGGGVEGEVYRPKIQRPFLNNSYKEKDKQRRGERLSGVQKVNDFFFGTDQKTKS
jgi:hypothetical protein